MTMPASLFDPLTDDELDQLNDFLLDRLDEEAGMNGEDEGILDISELDGFLTAIISGPVMVPVSQWLQAVWGDYEPEWRDEKAFQTIISLMLRHMNGIAEFLAESPDQFEPLFQEREVEGRVYTIVDEWCEGYLRGVSLIEEEWLTGGEKIATMLAPIYAFTEMTEWLGHKDSSEETEILQRAIMPSVSAIHAFWLARRGDFSQPDTQQPFRRGERVGRNDPCPCGSGKKYKKCCLH